MRTAILVPRRDDGGHRDRLWTLLRRRWETLHPDWPIFEGYHEEGPFNRSAAINRAAKEAGAWDVAVIIDADILVDPRHVTEAVDRSWETRRVIWAHQDWRGVNRAATDRVLERPATLLEPRLAFLDPAIEKTNPISWSCCIAVPRTAWDAIGGFDERFRGWGWEDHAFAALAVAHNDDGTGSAWHGGDGIPGQRVTEGSVYHLWHPRTPGSGTGSRDVNGRMTPDAILNAQLGRRYMVALRRDHGYHDRASASDAEDMRRDLANLQRDDEKVAREAERLGIPALRGWWPTLAELRSGVLPGRSIALVVHSGGSLDAWETRSVYLRRALASLDKHATYPWERRVIFSDWGPSDELVTIATEHGFTVEGPNVRLGYTKSMQAMWMYLRRLPVDHVFLTEDDFVLDRPIDVGLMSQVLHEHPELIQLALLRAPFYPAEMDPASILGHPREEFTPRENGAGTAWLEHRRFFTANPMLMRRSLARQPWPEAMHSEAVFGRRLFRHDKRAQSAFWGTGDPWITHIGEVRGGGGY